MRNEPARGAVLAAILVLTIACSKTPSAPTMTTSTQPPPVAANGPRVTFPDGYVVQVELATTDELRAQGLMYRDRLREGTGMLFLFADTDERPFWMKNTLIPLDMIWLDQQKRVAAVHFNVPPCKADPCPSYAPHAPSMYVLEVAGGVAQQHGIKVGDVLRFEGLENVPVR